MSNGELDLETRLRQEMEKKDEEIEALKAKAEERRRRQEEDARRQEEEKARIEAERRQREVFSISFSFSLLISKRFIRFSWFKYFKPCIRKNADIMQSMLDILSRPHRDCCINKKLNKE